MPKIIDHEQRRQDIIAVAKELMTRGGFEAATMRGIAAEAGFANGALKHYFDGKDSIVSATFQSVLDEMRSSLLTVDSSTDPSLALREYIEAGLPLDAHRISSARVLLAMWEHSVGSERVADVYRDHLGTWRQELVSRLVAACRALRPDDDISEDDPVVAEAADEVIAVSIGSNITSLMFSDGRLVDQYRAYAGRVVARLSE